MVYVIAKCMRFLCILLVPNRVTYYLGMIMVRIGRILRKNTYNSSKASDIQIISMFNNIKIKVDRFSYMGGSIFWTGFHHQNEIIYLDRYLQDDMFFVDIGANQGEFSLLAAFKLTNGKVFSFEPVTYQRNLLKENKALNKYSNIQIYDFGLGSEPAELPIYTSSDKFLHHGVHEGLSSLYSSESRDILQEVIQIKVFDEIFFDNLTRLDFIKIDIEGAELYALKGMVKSITKFKPNILIEINEETFLSAGYNTKAIIDFFNELNYNFYQIYKGQLKVEKVISFEKWGNYIAKHNGLH